jgi:hypothetical protein
VLPSNKILSHGGCARLICLRALLILTIILHDHFIGLVGLGNHVTSASEDVHYSLRVVLIFKHYVLTRSLGRDVCTMHLCLTVLVTVIVHADGRLILSAVEEAVANQAAD